jgi:channel protein (hemolysin III family)
MVYYVLFVLQDFTSVLTHDVLIAQVPLWPLFVYIMSAITVLTGSWYYHLSSCVSEEVNMNLRKYDYAGISIMIAGGTTPAFVYGFNCKEVIMWKWIWLG